MLLARRRNLGTFERVVTYEKENACENTNSSRDGTSGTEVVMTNIERLEQDTAELCTKLTALIHELDERNPAPFENFPLRAATVDSKAQDLITAWLSLSHNDGAREVLDQVLNGSLSFRDFEPDEPVQELIGLRSRLAHAMLGRYTRQFAPQRPRFGGPATLTTEE